MHSPTLDKMSKEERKHSNNAYTTDKMGFVLFVRKQLIWK